MIKIKNIIPILITFVITCFLTFTVLRITTIHQLKQVIEKNEILAEKQFKLINELSKIEKYNYTIDNKFDKIKPKKGTITLDLNNDLVSKINNLKNNDDSIIEKKSLWNRIFR